MGVVPIIKAVATGCEIFHLIDRDDHANADVSALEQSGVRVLSRRHIECFLYDDEVLADLCARNEHDDFIQAVLDDKAGALAAAVERGNPEDDVKSAAGTIYNSLKQRLSLTRVGNDAKAFERNVLAPLLQPGMKVYEELKNCIFSSASA
jgi:hypothetical protein